MSDVKEAVDPQKVALQTKPDHAPRLSEHAQHLMSECHVKNNSGHAAEWWKKAHASAIQAMPEQIKCHDSVKGQVGTTLWDVAHASLESRGQKGSVKHEMQRIADLNHMSVDCNDLRGKEIHLHAAHAKPAEAPCPPKHEAPIPVPVPRPEVPCPPKPHHEHHAKEHYVPLPPRRPEEPCPPKPHHEVVREPQVITAPPESRLDRFPPPPPPPRDGYDVGGYRPEPCHQPNILDLFNPLGIGRTAPDCRVAPPPPPPEYYGGPRGYDSGYDQGGANFGVGIGVGLGLGALFNGGPRYPHHEHYGYRERANSFPIGGGYQEMAPPPMPVMPMRGQMQRYSRSYSSAPTMEEPCPPGMMNQRHGYMTRR